MANELGDWLARNLSPEVVDAGRRGLAADTLDTLRQWNRQLADAGWAAVGWPVEHGGRAAGIDEQVACLEVMASTGAPGPINDIGVANIAPAIMVFGTDRQKARYLRPLLRGEEIWSQGMSEPGAGSDLGSLRTTAVVDGDELVVNGQKTWTSHGDMADWCQMYVRTDPSKAKHQGLSCLLVDMRTPGIDVRPLRTLTGETPFAEVWLDQVRVPRRALLGRLQGGWHVAMTTLGHERAGVARLHVRLGATFARLLRDVSAAGLGGDAQVRQRLAGLYAAIACMGWTTARSLAQPAGTEPSAAVGSLAKLSWAGIEQAMAETAVDVLGAGALGGTWGDNLLRARQASIAGGTSEINRTVVAEHALGLPRSR